MSVLAALLFLSLMALVGVLARQSTAEFEARRKTWRQAAKMLNERADFEMADTEGQSILRFNRIQLLREMAVEFARIGDQPR